MSQPKSKHIETDIDLGQKFDQTAQLIRSLNLQGENKPGDPGIEAFASVVSTLPHRLQNLGVPHEIIEQIESHNLKSEITKHLSESEREALAKLIDCKNGLAAGVPKEISGSWGKVVDIMKAQLAMIEDPKNIAWKIIKNNRGSILALLAGSIGLYGAYRLLCKHESEQEKPKEKGTAWWKILLLGGIVAIGLGFGIGSILGLDKVKKYLKDKWDIAVEDAVLKQVLEKISGGKFDEAYSMLTQTKEKAEALKERAKGEIKDLKKAGIALAENKKLLDFKNEVTTKVENFSKKLPENMSVKNTYESASRIANHFKEFEKNYPEEMETLRVKHPKIVTGFSGLSSALLGLDGMLKNKTTDEAYKKAIENYNDAAKKLNEVLHEIQKEKPDEASSEKKAQLEKMVKGEIEFDEKSLTKDEKEELKKFAQDVYDMLFPESYTDKFVQWSTGQKGRLNSTDRLAAAPMNGIEAATKGILSLLNPFTYVEMYKSAKAIYNMSSEEWDAMTNTLKFAYNNASTTDKIAPVIAFLSSLAMFGGGLSKLGKVAESLGYSKKILVPIDALIMSKRLAHTGKFIHIGEIVGETLPYITM